MCASWWERDKDKTEPLRIFKPPMKHQLPFLVVASILKYPECFIPMALLTIFKVFTPKSRISVKWMDAITFTWQEKRISGWNEVGPRI